MHLLMHTHEQLNTLHRRCSRQTAKQQMPGSPQACITHAQVHMPVYGVCADGCSSGWSPCSETSAHWQVSKPWRSIRNCRPQIWHRGFTCWCVRACVCVCVCVCVHAQGCLLAACRSSNTLWCVSVLASLASSTCILLQSQELRFF